MGSSNDTRTSLHTSKNALLANYVGDDSGTSEQMINRKVHLSWKKLRRAFLDIGAKTAKTAKAGNGEGWVTPEQLRGIFNKFGKYTCNPKCNSLQSTTR